MNLFYLNFLLIFSQVVIKIFFFSFLIVFSVSISSWKNVVWLDFVKPASNQKYLPDQEFGLGASLSLVT